MVLIVYLLLWGQYVPFERALTPRQERARRESAVARTGAVARELVEKYGEDAVKTLAALTPETGQRLAKFHIDGGVDRMSRPRDFLAACRLGDDVCAFGIANAKALQEDSDALAAFAAEPEVFALRLRSLADGAAQARSRRLNAAPIERFPKDARDLAIVAAGLGLAVWLLSRWKQKRTWLLTRR